MMTFKEIAALATDSVFYENVEGMCVKMKVISKMTFIPENKEYVTDYIRFRAIDEKDKMHKYKVVNMPFGYYGLFKTPRTSRPTDYSYAKVKNPGIS